MGLIKVDDLTLNPREVESASSILFEHAFNNPELSEVHDIETGIDMKTQILFGGTFGLLGKKAGEDCEPSAAEGFELTEKYWTPVMEDFRLKHCQADMPALLKIFRDYKRINPDFYDQVGTEQFRVIIAAAENALKENILRKIWFNSTTADNVADGGVVPNNYDIDFFNSFDGLFKQIFTEVTGANKVAIVKNAGANYAAQVLDANQAYETFEKMLNVADERLVADAGAFILATRSMADNYRATLRNKSLGAGFIEITENGRPKLYFDGIEIKVRYDWDRNIKAYENNGVKYNLPHRAILTTKSNIPVGTLSTEDLESLDVFYDRTLKTNMIDGAYTIDAKHLRSYMTVAAY